jgi:hypothetical protein
MVMEANFFTRAENQFDWLKAIYSFSCDLAFFELASLDLLLQGGVGMDALYKQSDVSIWN